MPDRPPSKTAGGIFPKGNFVMIRSIRVALPFAPLAVLLFLGGCVIAYAQLEQKYQQMQQSLQAEINADQVKITQLQGELKVTFKDQVLYPSGGWQLTSSAQQTLSKIVPSLVGLKNTKVVVDGYTDNVPVGPELRSQGIANNIDLSSRRADGVVSYLASQGVNRNLLSAQGFGDAHPIASNETAQGRAQNRRIEVTLVGDGS
jgi:chemotaxis protein MotB